MATSTIKQQNAANTIRVHSDAMNESALPNDISIGVWFDVKSGSTIGLSGNYYTLITIKPWPDTSIEVQQMALGADGICWRRSSANAWTVWNKL